MRRFSVFFATALFALSAFATVASADPGSADVTFDGDQMIVKVAHSGPLTLVINGVEIKFPAPGPAPAAAVDMASGPVPGQKLFGSCSVIVRAVWSTFHWRWVNNVQRLQPWDTPERNDIATINDAHREGQGQWVTCNLEPSPTGAWVEATGRTFDVAPGERWFHQFPPGDFAVGFAARPK